MDNFDLKKFLIENKLTKEITVNEPIKTYYLNPDIKDMDYDDDVESALSLFSMASKDNKTLNKRDVLDFFNNTENDWMDLTQQSPEEFINYLLSVNVILDRKPK
jgi:hypothetical protein